MSCCVTVLPNRVFLISVSMIGDAWSLRVLTSVIVGGNELTLSKSWKRGPSCDIESSLIKGSPVSTLFFNAFGKSAISLK